MKSFTFSFLCLFISIVSYGQFIDQGPIFGLGVGLGYSSHANTYQVIEKFRVKEFSGFRAFVFEAKLGYAFSEKTAVTAIARTSPSNATVSPYHSFYAGLAISQGLWGESSVYVIGGAGYNKAAIEKGQKVGSGVLGNLGIGKRLTDNFYLEFNTLFGRMDEPDNLDPNPFRSDEFKFYVTVAYTIL